MTRSGRAVRTARFMAARVVAVSSTPPRTPSAERARLETSVRAVLLDLDDTLIEEEPFARAQLRHTAALIDGVDGDTWDDVVIESARSLWRASTYYPEFPRSRLRVVGGALGHLRGGPPPARGLGGLGRDLPPRRVATALDAVGHDPGAPDSLVDSLVDALVAASTSEGQRSGHPVLVLPAQLDLVARLANAVPVAIVTNGPPDIQRLKIEQAGIGAHLVGRRDLGRDRDRQA